MKTPSMWLKAVGPCCCPLMKKVSVCLFRSSSRPTVAPLHTPPSVLRREAPSAPPASEAVTAPRVTWSWVHNARAADRRPSAAC